MDLLAFPENVLACILQSLPIEQLLNISRVHFIPTQALESKSRMNQGFFRWNHTLLFAFWTQVSTVSAGEPGIADMCEVALERLCKEQPGGTLYS